MARFLSVLILSVTLVQPARADDASRRQLAEELLMLMDSPKNTKQMYESLKQMQMAQLKKMDTTEGKSEAVKSFQKQIMDLMSDELDWDKIKSEQPHD